MSIQQVQTGYSAALNVRLLDASGDPLTGITYGQLTVRYQKHGGSWTTKTVQAAEWVESSSGRYTLSFSDTELDTDGRFLFQVDAPSAVTFTGDVDVVSDWATAVDMLTSLLNGLNTKVSRSDAATVKHQQDDAIGAMNVRVDSLMQDISRIKSQLTVLLTKLKSMS